MGLTSHREGVMRRSVPAAVFDRNAHGGVERLDTFTGGSYQMPKRSFSAHAREKSGSRSKYSPIDSTGDQRPIDYPAAKR
jgi:hypothetical protein